MLQEEEAFLVHQVANHVDLQACQKEAGGHEMEEGGATFHDLLVALVGSVAFLQDEES